MKFSLKSISSVLALSALILAVTGCSRDSEPIVATGAKEERTVELRVIDEKQFDSIMADYHGKVVLVDYWATWCLSCVELFPHTVELHDKYGAEGLAVISVSLDDPDEKAAVLDFLKKHRARYDNFISTYGAGTESLEKFDLPGPLPQLQIFDREGKLRYTFPEPQSSIEADDVDKAVQELLARG